MSSDKHLAGKVALVTGCSRGIGKGLAFGLGQAGATVYLTGRPVKQSANSDIPKAEPLESLAKEIEEAGGKAIVAYCDHSDPEQTRKLFERIDKEQKGQLDILVNNAFAAVQFIVEHVGQPFYAYSESPEETWELINNVGLKNNYICAVHAAKLMAKRGKGGVILNVSSTGGANYFLGAGKEAIDRMSADMAIELADKKVTVLSVWVGAVKTELINKIVLEPQNPGVEVFENGQSIYYAGRTIAALLKDPNFHKRTGQTLSTSQLGQEYNVVDVDGKMPGDPRLDQYNKRREESNKVRLESLKL
ncbi:Oxidoreductase, short chain dehydrogenase/reductase family protein [Aphelenchoides bicaudatus]|nr:Oxidoreductase, short chain dehydrogenase/reductase family protein [Aphelenchoides bicaudatus]